MTRLWGFFVTAHQSRPPLSTAVGAWIDMFSGLARSDLTIPIGLPRARSMLAWSSLLALTTCLLLPVAAVSAWRARRRFECWFATMTGLACLVSAWSATRIAESIVDHEVFWVSAIGVMALASTLAWVADRINLYGSSGAWHWLKPMVCGMFALTAVLIGTREIRQIVEHSNYPNPDEIAVLRLSDAVLAESRQQGIHKPLVRIEQRWWPLAAGVLLQLDKAAMPLSVERRWVPVFGEALAPRGDEDWEVTIGGTVVHDRLCARAGNVTLAERGNVYVDAVPLVRVPDSK